MANFASCAGVIIDAKQKVFIDVNLGRKVTPGIIKAHQPDIAVITHYHLDHSVWTRDVKDYSDAVVFVPQPEEKYLTSLEYVIRRTAGELGKGELWQEFVVNTLGYRALQGHQTYDNSTGFGDMVPGLIGITTPGHSPAHTSFYFSNEKILFSGDLGLDRFGPWYGWNDCDIKKTVESILRLSKMQINLILTSHGGILKKDIQTAWKKAIHHLVAREEKIRGKRDMGLKPSEIINQGVFFSDKSKVAQPMRDFLLMWDTAMYRHHEKLLDQGGLRSFFPELKNFTQDIS